MYTKKGSKTMKIRLTRLYKNETEIGIFQYQELCQFIRDENDKLVNDPDKFSNLCKTNQGLWLLSLDIKEDALTERYKLLQMAEILGYRHETLILTLDDKDIITKTVQYKETKIEIDDLNNLHDSGLQH